MFGSMSDSSRNNSPSNKGCSTNLPAPICAISPSCPRTLVPYSTPPITNSATGAEAKDSISTSFKATVGNFTSVSDKVTPAMMPRIKGLRDKRLKVSRNTLAIEPPPWLPASARARESGIITRFSTIIPSAKATPAWGPTATRAMGKPMKPLLEVPMPMPAMALLVRL